MVEFVSYGRAPSAPSGGVSSRRAPSVPGGGDGRLAWADTAKGICIILVVMMHTTLGIGSEMGGEGFLHTVVAFAKPFRMPDFFLVSGLFLARVVDRDLRSYADRRVVHFAYFYILWLVIQSGFKFMQISGGSPAVFLHHLAVSLVEPFSTLWFIYLLGVFSVVTKLLRRAPPALLFGAAAALQIMPVETGSFLVNEFCERWVYFLAGYLFAPHVFRLAAWARQHVAGALGLVGLWALANGALALTVVDLGGRTVPAELPVVGLLAGLAGAVAIVVVASVLTRLGLAGPLRYCGSNSISIYLTFFLPMAIGRTVLARSGIIDDIGVAASLVTAFAVLVPLGLERLSRGTQFAFLYRRPGWAHLPPRRDGLHLAPAE